MKPRARFYIESLENRLLLAANELISNGKFEGTPPLPQWTLSGNFQANSTFSSYNSSPGYAYLADFSGNPANSISGTMYQQFTIPSNATSLSLSFWTRISTSETTTTLANDTMSVSVMNSTGTTTLQSLSTYSNLNSSASYVQRTFSLSRSLIGQTVRLMFSAANNASLATTFRVDDVSLNAVTPATSNRVVGYLPYYRYSSAFSKLDWTALTHVNYFSVTSSDTGVLTTTNVTATALNNVVATAHAAGVTVGITVGPQDFDVLAASSTARQTFATNIVNYALSYNLDNIDIDWEPPTGNNNPAYANLINDLYSAANPHKIMITAAVNPWTNEIPAATVNTKMDWLNVMCYDFDYANHSTYTQALSGLTDWFNYGVSKNKIVMGLPFYGRQGTSWSNTTSATYATMVANHLTANSVFPGPEIDLIDGFYGNGVETIRKKMQYVIDNAYGGAMIWELGQDRWNGSNLYDYRSLLPVIKSVIRQSSAYTSVTPSPADNANAPLGGTQTVAVTVTFNAPAAGVLQVSLLAEAQTPARDWYYVSAPGVVTRTLNIPVSEAASGQQFYEIYTQFRPGASSGPLTAIDDTDLLKLTPYRLNWVTFPGVPSSPSPANNAALSAAPTLLDWADASNATSYQVYVDAVLRGTVTSSQWTPNIGLSSGVNHTWQIIAVNANGTTSGPTWNFSWTPADSIPPLVQSGNFNIDTRQITLNVSESVQIPTGIGYYSLTPGGSEISASTGAGSGATVTFTLPAGLADGHYKFRMPAANLRDLANNPLAGDWNFAFSFLSGDANGDWIVNTQDFNRIAANFGTNGKVFSQGNFSYDVAGEVNSADFVIFAGQYGKNLPAPGAPLSSTALASGTPLFADGGTLDVELPQELV